MAGYLAELEGRPVLRYPARPGETLAQLRQAPPEHGEGLPPMLEEIERAIEPHLRHYGHPTFRAYLESTTSAPGIYGEMLASAYDVSAMLWRTSPAGTELESLVLRWIREWLGLSPSFEGLVYDTASVSSMHALAAAREQLGLDVRERGLTGRDDVATLCELT